jgi:SWI/SNF-related matrix-associated actin-dependent regulator 1 of chromatin subfamily A
MTNDYDLFPYQVVGADFLAQRTFALLADEMGLGKSAQAIRACDLLFARRILVLCPAIARVNWTREFERFSLYGLPAWCLFTRTDRTSNQPGITVCSYDLLTEPDIAANLGAVPWDVMICDESHYLKTLTTKRTKAVLGKHGLLKKAARVWLLSGTPMTNHPGDLWPLLYVSNTTPLKYEEFTAKFCTGRGTPFGWKITGANHAAIPELKALLAKIMLRRRKTEVLKDLPPITFSAVTVEAGPVDLEISMFELWKRAGGDEKLMDIIKFQDSTLANAMGLVTNRPKAPTLRELLPVLTGMEKSLAELRLHTGLCKVAAAVEMVRNELDAGLDKIVLFACHRMVIEGLREGLRKYGAVTLYGGTPPAKRQINIDKFQKDKRCRVFIANIQAAGTSVTLTAAAEAMFVECDWTPANNAQAAMRVHRIGQTRPVRIRYCSLANSTDEKVTDALRRKSRDELAIFSK